MTSKSNASLLQLLEENWQPEIEGSCLNCALAIGDRAASAKCLGGLQLRNDARTALVGISEVGAIAMPAAWRRLPEHSSCRPRKAHNQCRPIKRERCRMEITWTHGGPTFLASFLAAMVEAVEALTVILAVGSVRGWSGALSGCATAIAVLLALVAVLGRALTRVPLHTLQTVIGALLLLFGLRWLRKAILRSAGRIALHDEEAAFTKNVVSMQGAATVQGWDRIAFAAAFQIVMLEGTEVVFIVIGVSAGGLGLLLPASLGAIAALLLVTALGAALRRPLARIPENTLKFAVGILLSCFGTFWVGEGLGLGWPGDDWSILAVFAGYLVVALSLVALCRKHVNTGVQSDQ